MTMLLKKLYVLRRLRKNCWKMFVIPQHCMLTAYTCSTLCLWLCYIEGEHPQHILSISPGISQSCHPCAGEADAEASPQILCCTGPAAHTSRGGFTRRFACCSNCVCDNKPPHSPSNPLHPSWSCWVAEKSRASCWRMEREDPAVGR